MRRLVLFDIDGTLLSSASAGRMAIQRAFAEEYDELGFFDEIRFDGKTDPQIVRELHVAAGRPERATDESTTRLLNRYLEFLQQALDERAGIVRSLPGITRLLETLGGEVDACVGLLTGNVEAGARLKLEAAGLPMRQFRLGAFGSDSGHRPDLPGFAVRRAGEQLGFFPKGEEVVIIGDTPADVTCGESIGVRTVAVATGSYSVAELNAAGADSAFQTLENTAEVVDAIMAAA